MLTREQAQKMAERILSFSKFPECSLDITDSEESFVRFANNGITTAGLTNERTVTISSTREKRTGVTRTTDFSDEALKAAVARSEELAAISPVNQEDVDPIGPQEYLNVDHWDEQTAAARSPVLIAQIRPIILNAVGKKLVAAGFFTRTASISAIANKKGNFGFSRSTDSRLATTVRTPGGTSSGWNAHPSVRIGEISGAEVGAKAIETCLAWNKPAKIEPGKYTVVLHPTAVNDLTQQMLFSFSARQAEEGRSFLSRKGGGTQLGEKLFPEHITMRSDPTDRRFPSSPWGQNGLPNRPINWIEKGVVRNLSYDRYWAMKAGKQPTSTPSNVILEGDTGTAEDLAKTVDKGLLVTRFWYVRFVNPQTLQYTGLTRDGLFLIENGKITQPVINLRFNESPVRMLQNTVKLGAPRRARGGEGSGMIVPPLVATNFTFTSVSDAI